MIQRNATLVIQRVANGYLVGPLNFDTRGVGDQLVFIDKGYVSASRDYQDKKETLFGWLDQHFTDPEQK